MSAAYTDSGEAVSAEIARIVSRARETRAILEIDDCSSRIAVTYPGSGLALEQIADALARRAVAAGVQIEFSQGEIAPDHPGGMAPRPFHNDDAVVDRSEAASRQLLFEEIARILAKAKANGEIVRAGYHAGMLAIAYPGANFSIGRMIDEIILAAAKAALPVDMQGRPNGGLDAARG